MKNLLVLIMIMICVNVFAQPTITSFVPTRGEVGTTVTIYGTNFNTTTTNNIVFFGATQATVTAASDTSLNVTVPMGATYEPISVTDSTTGLTAYSAQPFITTFPCSGPINSNSFATKVDFTAGSRPYGVSIGDIDGDGKPDLIVANIVSNNISILRNTSSNNVISFDSKVDFYTGYTPFNVSLGDLNGDGKLDIAVANNGSSYVTVLRNTSTIGTISFAPRVNFTTGSELFCVSMWDLDGDGKIDLAVTNFESNTVSILRNTSTISAISFASKIDLVAGSNPTGISIRDIDGDGKPDLAVAIYDASVAIFRNTSISGAISFAAKVSIVVGSDPICISLGDLDGDTKPDIVIGNWGNSRISILKNISTIGNISFGSVTNYTSVAHIRGISITDIDSDGKLDIAASNSSSNTVSVYRNISTSDTIAFAYKIDFISGLGPYGVSIGDVNGDTKPDLIVAKDASNTVSVLKNIIDSSPVAPVISQVGLVLISNAPFGNQWYNENGIINGATNRSYTIMSNGSYYDIVTTAGCSSAPSNIITFNSYGIALYEEFNPIKLYPNPVNNEIIIEMEGNNSTINFEILNTIGQVVLTGNFVKKTTIQLSNFKSGVYIVKLENGRSSMFKKIIKE